MSGRHWRNRIEDILDAITEIQSFVAGTTLEQFKADAKTLKAVAADLIDHRRSGESHSHNVQGPYGRARLVMRAMRCNGRAR